MCLKAVVHLGYIAVTIIKAAVRSFFLG